MLYIFIGLVLLAVLALKLSQMAKAPAKASHTDSSFAAFGNERRLLQSSKPAIIKREILSPSEHEFFNQLQKALPNYHIFPQVAANALLRVAPEIPKTRTHIVRNRFAQKHVDFLVCERTTLQVKAIIELDDRTHRADKDKTRDEMFSAAGYVTHRFESRRKPSDDELAKLFASAVSDPELPSDAVTLNRQHTQTW